MLTAILSTLLATSFGYQVPLRSPVSSTARTWVRMGLFDGVKDAFGGDKPLPAADRVTPFDRWMGLDTALVEESAPSQTASYVDPNDVSNYFSVEIAKPMGIAFVENDGSSGGVYVDEVLPEGSAAACGRRAVEADGERRAPGADALHVLVLGVDVGAVVPHAEKHAGVEHQAAAAARDEVRRIRRGGPSFTLPGERHS